MLLKIVIPMGGTGFSQVEKQVVAAQVQLQKEKETQ